LLFQAGDVDAGFTMKRYGDLFDTVKVTPADWWDDLLWPGGYAPFRHSPSINCLEGWRTLRTLISPR